MSALAVNGYPVSANDNLIADVDAFFVEGEAEFDRVIDRDVDNRLSGDGNGPRAPSLSPTFADPLAGLDALGPVALVGRERILEAAAAPVPFVWQDIAVLGTIVVIAGDPGGGKTTLLFLLLASRISLVGTEPVPLLNRDVYPAPAGQYVILIEGEHSEGSTARKLLKSLRVLGLSDAALCRVIIVARKAVRIGSPAWDDVARLVAAGLVSDIALDTLARVAPADGDNEREQVAIFDSIAQVIEGAPSPEQRPTCWIVAHTRKTSTGELTDVSGSTQRTGQADSVLLSRATREDGRVTSVRVVFQKLREEPDDYPAPVDFAVTKEGVVYADASTGAEADDRPLEERILERLALGPRTKNKLSTELGRNKETIQAAVDALFDARRIRGASLTIRNRTYKALEIRPNHGGLYGGLDSTTDDGGRTADGSRKAGNNAG